MTKASLPSHLLLSKVVATQLECAMWFKCTLARNCNFAIVPVCDCNSRVRLSKCRFFIHTYVHREKVGAALPDHPSQASHCPQQLAPFRPVCPQDSGALGPGTYNLSTPPRYPLPLSSRAPVRFRCFLRRPWRLSSFVTSSPSWPTASRPWL